MWVISGEDRLGRVWKVRADDAETAAHISSLFQREGYTRVIAEFFNA